MTDGWNTGSLIAAATAAGAALGGLGTWLLQAFRLQQDGKKDATTVALQALMSALDGQRAEITRLNEEAASAREEAAACEKKYRTIRDEMDVLRRAMTDAGLRVPLAGPAARAL